MNLKAIVAGVVLLILLLIFGAVIFKKTAQAPSEEANTTTGDPTKTEGQTLAALLGSGKNQSCTYTVKNADSGEVTGTIYISGKKFRGDFTTTNNDKSYDGSMISDGTMTYSWSNASKQGMKVVITEEMKKTGEEMIAQDRNKFLNPDQKVDYTCNSWSVDASKFIPPTDITFTDYSEKMKNIQGTLPSGLQVNCSSCDSLSGAAKIGCQSALKCAKN